MARLEYTSRDGAAAVLELAENDVLIGRISECAVCVDDGTVTRRHARVTHGPDGYCIRDLESDNGTYVNGQRITASTTLASGDVIECGRLRLRFVA